MRELTVNAIAMARRDEERLTIFRYLLSGARRLGLTEVIGDETGFQMRLRLTGQVIRFDGGGYRYSPS